MFQVSRKKAAETIKPARTTRAMRVFFIKLSPATEIGVFRRCSTAMLRRPVSGTRPGNTVFLRRGDDGKVRIWRECGSFLGSFDVATITGPALVDDARQQAAVAGTAFPAVPRPIAHVGMMCSCQSCIGCLHAGALGLHFWYPDRVRG